MITKAIYKLSYFLNKELKELLVIVELKQTDGFKKLYQNVWHGEVIVNDRVYIEDLSHCVDAKLAVEKIGLKLRDEIIATAKLNNEKIKIKKEEIK